MFVQWFKRSISQRVASGFAKRSRWPRRLPLRLEVLDDRWLPSTYTWNSGAGTLAITLATNESLTISEAAGTRSFALSSGTLTQSGGNTATGNGSPTISFAAGNNI